MTVLVSRAQRASRGRWVTASNSRRPSSAGAETLSQSLGPPNSQVSGSSVPPERRWRAYQKASMAAVPTAPATAPRSTAPSGVMAGILRRRSPLGPRRREARGALLHDRGGALGDVLVEEAQHLQRQRGVEDGAGLAQPVVERALGPADGELGAGGQPLGDLEG